MGAIVIALALAVTASFTLAGALAPNQNGGKSTGSGGCPSANAIGNFRPDPKLTAGFVISGNGTMANYTFGSDNENSSNGVPGLIEYCVYPSPGTLPSSATAVAVGADGSAFTVNTGSSQGYFSFARAKGNPTNLPLNGAQAVAMGNATWSGPAPTNQSIVLHINDPTVCSSLYTGNPSTCFVIPGSGTPSQCSQPGVAPAALKIPLRSPATTVSSGTTLGLWYEFAVVNFTGADVGATVDTPTVTFHLPLTSGDLAYTVAPSTATVGGSGWSTPVGKTATLGASESFATTGRAYLSTSNLAVLTSGGPANMTVEFRWSWSLNVSGTVTTAWSIPKATPPAGFYASIFVPAPFVGVSASSPLGNLTGGSYFWANLTGAVQSTSFRTLVETTNGVELHCQVETTSTASTFTAGVPLTYAGGTALPAGHYVIHVHDAMGAIVREFDVSVA